MDLLSVPEAKPSLPPKLKDAREMLKYAAIFFLIAALIYLLWGIWSIFTGLFWSVTYLNKAYSIMGVFSGIVRIVLGVVAFILKGQVVEEFIDPIDQGRTGDIDETKMIIYVVLGLIFGLIISGVLILLGYMKIDEVRSHANKCPTCGNSLRYIAEYDNWYCDTCQDYKVPVNPPKPPEPQSPGPQTGTGQNPPPPPPEDQ